MLALLLLPVGCALLIAGLVPTATSGGGWKIVGVVVLLLAVVLLAVALGLFRSAATDDAAHHEAAVDAAIMASTPCGEDCGSGACGVEDCAVKSLPRG
jgi:membrane protein implicated in regulation of membrane protease activity